MGSAERTERHRQQLRQNIMDAAEQLFIEDGYQNVSMRKIADKIEYSPTTIYRYFKNKDDLMHQLIGTGYKEVYRRYQEILDQSQIPPLEKLNLIIKSYIEFSLSTPNHYKLWFATSELTMVDGHLQMSHGDLSYKVYYVWLDRIDECKAEGLFGDRDTLDVFQLLWGSVHGMISLRIQHPRFSWMPVERHVDHLLAMLQRGLIH
jgi:AcrR family transcriptional regulator